MIRSKLAGRYGAVLTDFGEAKVSRADFERLLMVPWTAKGRPDRRYSVGRIAAEVLPKWEAACQAIALEKWVVGDEISDAPPLTDFGQWDDAVFGN